MPPLDHLLETSLDFATRPVRIAYFLTSRELAEEEPLYDPGDPVRSPLNLDHRGNLPRFAAMVNRGLLPPTELAAVLMNDDRPYRDFSDLGVPVLVQTFPSFFSNAPKGSPERKAAIATYRAAKADYERRLAEILVEHRIDFIVCDRYMIIHGPTMRQAFMGLLVNTHPARLPELAGATPTADALRRAHQPHEPDEQGEWYTGNTLHIIDEGIDTGPPIRQAETTPIYPTDQHWDLRRRNYEFETRNLVLGLTEYLRDPFVRELVALQRVERESRDGIRAEVAAHLTAGRLELIKHYRQLFKHRQRAEKRNRTPTGGYLYSAAGERLRDPLPWPPRFRIDAGGRLRMIYPRPDRRRFA